MVVVGGVAVSSRKDLNSKHLASNPKSLLFEVRVVHKTSFGKIKESLLLKIIINGPIALVTFWLSFPPRPTMGHIPSNCFWIRKHLGFTKWAEHLCDQRTSRGDPDSNFEQIL